MGISNRCSRCGRPTVDVAGVDGLLCECHQRHSRRTPSLGSHVAPTPVTRGLTGTTVPTFPAWATPAEPEPAVSVRRSVGATITAHWEPAAPMVAAQTGFEICPECGDRVKAKNLAS